MGDTQTTENESTEETLEQPPEGAQESTEEQQPAPEGGAEESTETPEQPSAEDEDAKDDGDHDELPAWAQKSLEKARKDAAGYRQRLAEANEKLSGAKSTEDFEAVQKELATVTLQLETERIANRHGLPDELRSVLKGESVEEISENAELLAKFVTGTNHVDPKDLSGGLDPSDSGSVVEDPRALARKHSRNR